jgi:hypothetical protein
MRAARPLALRVGIRTDLVLLGALATPAGLAPVGESERLGLGFICSGDMIVQRMPSLEST